MSAQVAALTQPLHIDSELGKVGKSKKTKRSLNISENLDPSQSQVQFESSDSSIIMQSVPNVKQPSQIIYNLQSNHLSDDGVSSAQ